MASRHRLMASPKVAGQKRSPRPVARPFSTASGPGSKSAAKGAEGAKSAAKGAEKTQSSSVPPPVKSAATGAEKLPTSSVPFILCLRTGHDKGTKKPHPVASHRLRPRHEIGSERCKEPPVQRRPSAFFIAFASGPGLKPVAKGAQILKRRIEPLSSNAPILICLRARREVGGERRREDPVQ